MRKIIIIGILMLFSLTACNKESVKLHVFESTNDCYLISKDENNVYFNGRIVKSADPATFEEVKNKEDLMFKDKDSVYALFYSKRYYEKSCDLETDSSTFLVDLREFKNADADSFEILSKYLYRDKNRVYYHNGAQVSVIERAVPNSFKILEWPYSKDLKNVYYYTSVLEGADPNKFEVLCSECVSRWTSGYGKDQKTVWHGPFPISDSDPDTFEVLNAHYARDKNNFYFNGEIVKQFDSESFEILQNGYSKNDAGVYYAMFSPIGEGGVYELVRLEGVDPNIFEVPTNGFPEDQAYVHLTRTN